MTNRWTKFLLGVMAVALCVIALRTGGTRDVNAQTPGAPVPAKISYQLVEATETFKAESKINTLAAQGWRATSVAVGAERTVVLMEKSAP